VQLCFTLFRNVGVSVGLEERQARGWGW